MKFIKVPLIAAVLCTALTACGTSPAPENSQTKAEIETTAPAAEKADISTGYIITNGQDYIELHKNADDADTIARMYEGEAVTIYSINSEWADISYGGMRGYVKLSYISFSKPEEKNEIPAETAARNQQAELTETAEPVPAVQNNVQNNNIQILFYVDNDGVEVAEPTYYASYMAEHDSIAAWCSAQSVYIYSQPTTDSYKREADMLYYGDVCYIIGSVDGWYYISTDSGSGYDLHGYVKQKYITTGATPVAPEPANASYGRVSAGSANVRSSPDKSDNSNVLFSLSKGDEFEVISYDGYWYKINYNGTICYISHKMVEVW